jgi:hypothetical protein
MDTWAFVLAHGLFFKIVLNFRHHIIFVCVFATFNFYISIYLHILLHELLTKLVIE